MKITCSRRDDLIQERNKIEERRTSLINRKSELSRLYRDALTNIENAIKSRITSQLGECHVELDIRVSTTWDDQYRVDIYAHEHDRSDSSALSWNWGAELTKDGEVNTSSGSWSGLKATTVEQLADLKESVRILEMLNNLDWRSILKAPSPRYEDYIDNELEDELREMNKRNIDDEIIEATLEEAAESGDAIEVKGFENPYYRNTHGFVQLVSKSDKFYKVKYVPGRQDDNEYKPAYSFEDAPIIGKRKDSLISSLVKPLNIISTK